MYLLCLAAPWWYEALYSPMIVAVGWLGLLPRSDNPLQVTYTLGTCQTSMMCRQKCSQIIFDTSWNSRPDQSECQCTMMVWGTVFTNDCCSRLVVSITKVWQPFTSDIQARNMSDINDVSPNGGPDLCHRSWNSRLLTNYTLVHHHGMRYCIHQWLLQ